MSDTREQPSVNSLAWPVALAAVTVIGTLATACMMPFVALAVAAAATMPRTRAAATVVAVWAANQALGFTLLGYPPTAFAFAWGAALCVASLVAMRVADAVLGEREPVVARLLIAFLAAFVAYEGGLFGFALVAGGTETFTTAIVLKLLGNEAVWFVVLAAMHVVLARAAPRTFGAPLVLRSA